MNIIPGEVTVETGLASIMAMIMHCTTYVAIICGDLVLNSACKAGIGRSIDESTEARIIR